MCPCLRKESRSASDSSQSPCVASVFLCLSIPAVLGWVPFLLSSPSFFKRDSHMKAVALSRLCVFIHFLPLKVHPLIFSFTYPSRPSWMSPPPRGLPPVLCSGRTAGPSPGPVSLSTECHCPLDTPGLLSSTCWDWPFISESLVPFLVKSTQ